jgi:predicted XRE-type DNA-binding protein
MIGHIFRFRKHRERRKHDGAPWDLSGKPFAERLVETYNILYNWLLWPNSSLLNSEAARLTICVHFQTRPDVRRATSSTKSSMGEALPRFAEGIGTMSKKRFANVWDAIEDTPAQAENMKFRSALMMALKNHIGRTGLSQAKAAKLLGVTQPRVSDLMRGKIELFGLDTLVNMIGAAGLHVEMRVSDAA